MGLTVIEGGLLGSEDGLMRADIVIDGDTISSISLDASGVDADERIDATGMLVLPGFIDVHTHFNDPHEPPLEGFATGSAGAAAGGVTSVVEMPQATPPSSEGAHITSKIQLGEAQSVIDFALWGGVINQDLDKIDEMIGEGIVALKAFMASSSYTFPRATDDTLIRVLRQIASTDIPLGVHAENDDMLQANIARMHAVGRKDPAAHIESRPPIVEIEAIQRALFLAEQTGAHIYICHCSTVESLRLIKQARQQGVRVSVETCPHYLTLNADQAAQLGPYGRCAPAMRSQDEIEGIWEFLIDGTIDIVSSDHCGVSTQAKENGRDDIWAAPMGLSGIQTTFPILFDEMIHKRGLDVGAFIRLASTNAARIFSLFPRKGVLQAGADADVVIFDPAREWTVMGSQLLHRHKWSPFEGRVVTGQVMKTLVRGQTVYSHDHESDTSGFAGHGRFLPQGYGARQPAGVLPGI